MIKINARRICVVTGGSGFLGETIVKELTKEGYQVVSLDKTEPQYELGSAIYFQCDILNRNEVKELLGSYILESDSLEVLINNAAIDAKVDHSVKTVKSFANYDLDSLQNELGVAIQGSLTVIQECLPYFFKSSSTNKSIIYIGSDLAVIAPDQRIYKDNAGKQTFLKPVSYSIVKHATLGLIKYLAVEFAQHGIRVNGVSPGPIMHEQPIFVKRNIEERVPLGRLATRDDAVSAIKFLANQNSGYITGQNIQVDGGRTIW